MWFRLLKQIRESPPATLAVIAGLAVLTFAFVYPRWWGERSLGVLIGAASTLAAILILAELEDRSSLEIPVWGFFWALVIVPTGTALILRSPSGQSSFHLPVLQFHISAVPSPQSILLMLVSIVSLILLWALIRSLSRGESVSVESHWGGLGGGIAGWRLSAPLVYLLTIAFLLAISSTMAWHIFMPPAVPIQQEQQAQRQAPPAAASSPTSGSQNH
jgi:hypothetical protein